MSGEVEMNALFTVNSNSFTTKIGPKAFKKAEKAGKKGPKQAELGI